jgi:hypothetical protein
LGGNAGESFDLLEGQYLVSRPKLNILIWHAIETADIATIRHANPQIGMNASERIDKLVG